jgi:PAS domain S-box-containing protein
LISRLAKESFLLLDYRRDIQVQPAVGGVKDLLEPGERRGFGGRNFKTVVGQFQSLALLQIMNWAVVITSMVASACLMLAVVYFVIWRRGRAAWGALALAFAASLGAENHLGLNREERSDSHRRTALWLLLCGVGYYLATEITWKLCISAAKVSILFLPHAVLVSVLLLVPTRHWWAYTLAAICGHLVAAYQAHWPLMFALESEVFDAAQNVLVAAGIRIFIRSPIETVTLRDAIVFVLIAVVVVPFGTAFWGAALTLSYHYGTHYWVEWRKLGVANGVTAVVLVPAILRGAARLSAGRIKATPTRLLEGGLLGLGIVTVGAMVFDQLPAGPDVIPVLLYAPVPLLIWAALRFGLEGTSLSMLVIAFEAIWGAMRGHGPFLQQTPAENALSMQMFLLVTAVPLMLLAVGIEEEKRSQSALRESEVRFGEVANSAPVLIWMSDANKRCTFFNKRWLDFTGRTMEQECGEGWAEGVHAEDLARCLEVYNHAFDARQPFAMEYRLRRNDGIYRWIFDVGSPRFVGGEFLGYIGSCLDVTERRQAEEKFRQVIEASPNGIILLNDQGRIILVNPSTEQLFGYPGAELVGQTVELLVPERWRDRYRRLHDHYREAPGPRMTGARRELSGRRKDGTEFPLEFGLSPVDGPEGNQILIVIMDITARKQAEAESLRQRAELTHVTRVSTMGVLASSLAHELNQPLTAILSNAQAASRFLAAAAPNLAEVRGALDDVAQDAKRAGGVIRQMRVLVRRDEPNLAPLDLNRVIMDVVQLLHSDMLIRRVQAALEFDPNLSMVIGDNTQLQQLILNLVLNACDAMKDAPDILRTVTLRTRQLDAATIRAEVSDCGTGVSPDRLARLFEPFRTSKRDGMGLGLSICNSIIEVHKGRLWAENNPDRGATFYFTLPAHESELKLIWGAGS